MLNRSIEEKENRQKENMEPTGQWTITKFTQLPPCWHAVTGLAESLSMGSDCSGWIKTGIFLYYDHSVSHLDFTPECARAQKPSLANDLRTPSLRFSGFTSSARIASCCSAGTRRRVLCDIGTVFNDFVSKIHSKDLNERERSSVSSIF